MNYLILKNRILNSKLMMDSFWSLFGNVIGKSLALAAGIIVARYLGKDIYGEYGIIKNTIMSIAIFSTFGLGYTATKYIAEYKNSKPEYIKIVLRLTSKITFVFSGIMALILFIAADYIAEKILSAQHLNTSLRILSILIVINALTTTQIGVLSGFGKFKEIAYINTIIGAVTFISSLFLTYFFGLIGALIALLITQILNWILNFVLINKNTPKNIEFINSERLLLKQIFKFSTPVALQEAVYSFTSWLCSLLIIKFSSYGELGLFTAAMQWNNIVLFIPGILRNVILSHLSEKNKDETNHSRIMNVSLIVSFAATVVPAIFIFLFSNFFNNLYGISFKGLDDLIGIAVLTAVFMSIFNVYSQAYMSKGLNWSMFFIRLFRDLFIIITFFVLIRYSSIEGAKAMIYSFLFLYVLAIIITMIVYNRYLQNPSH